MFPGNDSAAKDVLKEPGCVLSPPEVLWMALRKCPTFPGLAGIAGPDLGMGSGSPSFGDGIRMCLIWG